MHADLLEKLKAATGPDRELDTVIECATGPWRPWCSVGNGIVVPVDDPDYWVFTEAQADAIIEAYPNRIERRAHFAEFGSRWNWEDGGLRLYDQGFASIHKNDKRRGVDRYTASIDASLTLAERILGTATMWSVCIMEDGPYAQILRPMPDGGYVGGHAGAYGNSAPLAILAALLSALSQGEQT